MAAAGSAQTERVSCDPDRGGLELPSGFCAAVFADDLGPTRQLVVTDASVVYVAMPEGEGAVVALARFRRERRGR